MIAPAADVLHRPVAALVRAYGVPASVATRDDGQRFVFADGTASVTAIVDDEATVHAVDVALPAGAAYVLEVEGKPHRFTFGTTTSLGARDELAADAETEGTGFRVFRLGAESEFVLVFDPKTSTLTRVVVGDRGALLRLGYLTEQQPVQRQFPYAAPKLRRSDVAEGSGTQATVLRLDLDRRGAVKNVAVVVPSGDAGYDDALVKRLARDAYVPAKLGGRSIGASFYREVRH